MQILFRDIYSQTYVIRLLYPLLCVNREAIYIWGEGGGGVKQILIFFTILKRDYIYYNDITW